MQWNKDERVLRLLMKSVSAILNRSITSQEQRFVATILHNTKPSDHRQYQPKEIVARLAQAIAGKIVSVMTVPKVNIASIQNPTNTQAQSMRDYLLQQIAIKSTVVPEQRIVRDDDENTSNNPTPTVNVESILGMSNIGQVQRALNPPSRYVYNYIVLDTQNRDASYDGIKSFRWRFVNEFDATPGTVAMKGYAENLRAIQLYQPLMARPLVNTSLASGRISILIKEFEAQSFIANGSRRYHFLTRSRYNASEYTRNVDMFVELEINEFNDGRFEFDPPITTFDALTVSFGNPTEVFEFFPDRLHASFAYGAQIIMTFDVNLLPLFFGNTVNTLVTIPNFTTDDPIADRDIITALTDPLGNFAVISGGNPFTLEFTDIPTLVGTPQVGTRFEVRFLDVRSVLMMELTFEVY